MTLSFFITVIPDHDKPQPPGCLLGFDANDPSSIENAIQEAYSMVDERASGYATNPMVSPLIEHMKENLRQQILDSAEQQRQESGQDGD
ncbi:hypothetical protein [Escherichia coli]|uniref:hypothetical protein n=1 Tax=Escherichia coli TaxID=562 RepID=UPI001F4653FE|nr:hypothetical protein [Escherichia coli]